MGFGILNSKPFLTIFVVLALLAGVFTPQHRAHALDKRVKMVLKTSAYGAGTGFLVGAATWAMGIGGLDNYRNLLIGTSVGLYAGIGLGLFVVATPPEPRAAKNSNPYQPRRPVGQDDWMNEDEEIEEYKREDDSRRASPAVAPVLATRDPVLQQMRAPGGGTQNFAKPVFWMPLAQVIF